MIKKYPKYPSKYKDELAVVYTDRNVLHSLSLRDLVNVISGHFSKHEIRINI